MFHSPDSVAKGFTVDDLIIWSRNNGNISTIDNVSAVTGTVVKQLDVPMIPGIWREIVTESAFTGKTFCITLQLRHQFLPVNASLCKGLMPFIAKGVQKTRSGTQDTVYNMSLHFHIKFI